MREGVQGLDWNNHLLEVSWLGGRDSNPDKQSQSLLSYR